MGLPSPKTMYPPDAPEFAPLGAQLETEWVPGLRNLIGLPRERLPVIWDADFLLGPPAVDGTDSYVLCEINCSCVTPFPPEAPEQIARATVDALETRRSADLGRSIRGGWCVHRLAHCDEGGVWDRDQPAVRSVEIEDDEEHHGDQAGCEQCHENAAFVRGEEHAEDAERQCTREDLQPEHR